MSRLHIVRTAFNWLYFNAEEVYVHVNMPLVQNVYKNKTGNATCIYMRGLYDCDQVHESLLPTKVTKKAQNGLTLQGEEICLQ